MAPGIFVRSISQVLLPYFMGTDRPGVSSVAVGFGIVVNFIGILVLLPRLGLVGAAWAMTLGYVASSLVLLVAFGRASGLGLREAWAPRAGDAAALRRAAGETWARLRGAGRRSRSSDECESDERGDRR